VPPDPSEFWLDDPGGWPLGEIPSTMDPKTRRAEERFEADVRRSPRDAMPYLNMAS
jgi:hypothetical protein